MATTTTATTKWIRNVHCTYPEYAYKFCIVYSVFLNFSGFNWFIQIVNNDHKRQFFASIMNFLPLRIKTRNVVFMRNILRLMDNNIFNSNVHGELSLIPIIAEWLSNEICTLMISNNQYWYVSSMRLVQFYCCQYIPWQYIIVSLEVTSGLMYL